MDRLRRTMVLMTTVWVLGCLNGPGVTTLNSEQLPVYGTDPLKHTQYVGSDQNFHYFEYQQGKESGSVRVPVIDAVVEPEPFPTGKGKKAFVEAAEEGRISLVVKRRGQLESDE
jgi:hypothetical protein